MRTAVRLAAQRAGLDVLAATGDPVARWLRGSPRTDVYDCYEQIRARGPLVHSWTGLYAVTSHELCNQLLRDRRLGVRRADGRSGFPGSLGGRQEASALGGSFVELDPPDHTRLRRIVATAFRPAAIAALTLQLEATFDTILERAIRAAHFGPIDLMSTIAAPYPIAAISSILGIPADETAGFARIGALVGRALDGIRTVQQGRELRAAELELAGLFSRLLAQRAVDPRDDVLSMIAAARRDGAASTTDAVHTAELLLITGFESTRHLIGNGVAALLSHPDRWRQLVADPDSAAAAVEETLRWDPPVQATGRIVHADLELAGRTLPQDSVIMILTAVAGRDPAVHPRPAIFDPQRRAEPDHLAFSSGIHYCLGAALARLEAEIAFRTLARGFPGLQLQAGARRRTGSTIRGFTALPVQLTRHRSRPRPIGPHDLQAAA